MKRTFSLSSGPPNMLSADLRCNTAGCNGAAGHAVLSTTEAATTPGCLGADITI